jgi:adenine-specific DNA methylase
MQKKFVADSHIEKIISQLAQDEAGKRQYYRPIYSIHKWWARRPGALFRSILLLAQEPGRKLFKTTYGDSISNQSEYFQAGSLENLIILDPFMGGGTTLVEANRLGAKVIGCDLNPVSYWIVRETLKPIDLDKLDKYFDQLEASAGEKIKQLYRTTCPHCHEPADSLYGFWVRYVACPHCQNLVYLYKRAILNEGLSRNKALSSSNPATVFCPKCFALNDWPGNDECSCSSCGHTFDPMVEVYDQGSYTCPTCHQDKISLIDTLKNGEKMREKLVAIEYSCPKLNTRLYKAPDEQDLQKLAEIQEQFDVQKDHWIFPRQKILPGDSSVRWQNHNYQHYFEVFNARQLLAFNYLMEGIRAIPEKEYQKAFITAFSNSLEYNNMMTPYNYPHRKLHHLFTYHAMPLTTTPVENAVWGVNNEGAGTFINCYRRYHRAKNYCLKPFDKYKNASGTIQTLETKGEKIAANFVDSFSDLKNTERGAMLLCGDSAKLPGIPDETVDFVITDPPYFDSIHYSELSNFFYVWLKCMVDSPYFEAEHVPVEQEAIVNTVMDKGEEEYQKLLGGVFCEAARVLKPEGKLIFTFHHTKWRAWWTVLQALLSADLRVIDSFPAMSEYKVNPHIRNKEALDMDLVLICQKRSVSFDEFSITPPEVLKRASNGFAHSNGNGTNQLFLHFMGELLSTASAGKEPVDYDWFATALLHFDDYIEILETQPPIANGYQQTQSYQLRLLDSESQMPEQNESHD